MRQLLSVDTGYDVDLGWFASERTGFYGGSVAQLKQADANRPNFLEKCRQRNAARPLYDAIAICTHGGNGKVYDYRGDVYRELFSESDSDEDLRTVGEGRCVYVFACETANSTLPDRLIGFGATIFVGFADSPSWQSEVTRRHWRDLDHSFLDCLIADGDATALRTVQTSNMRRIGMLIESGLHQNELPDLKKMAKTIESMVIVGP